MMSGDNSQPGAIHLSVALNIKSFICRELDPSPWALGQDKEPLNQPRHNAGQAGDHGRVDCWGANYESQDLRGECRVQ